MRIVASYDVVLIATNDDAFDYRTIQNHARLVSIRAAFTPKAGPNIVKA